MFLSYAVILMAVWFQDLYKYIFMNKDSRVKTYTEDTYIWKQS